MSRKLEPLVTAGFKGSNISESISLNKTVIVLEE